MALSDVMLGLQTWTDYVSTGDQAKACRTALVEHRGALISSKQDTQFAIETSSRALGRSVDEGLAWVAGGIAKLNADFNLLMGEAIWLLQLQDTHLKSILETLQAPLDTAAKELRRRAERAYENGWYDEALADFRESADRNYQDFAVHRSKIVSAVCSAAGTSTGVAVPAATFVPTGRHIDGGDECWPQVHAPDGAAVNPERRW